MLTLQAVADNPGAHTHALTPRDGAAVTVRPLVATDEAALATYLLGLSEQTRHFMDYLPKQDFRALAHEHCTAIARYDKLRFVVERAATIIGMLEFSMSLPGYDRERYDGYGIVLHSQTDCRYGLAFADAVQNTGLATLTLPLMWETARRFGRQRVILWGGVYADNLRAVHFYRKSGFRRVGSFRNDTGKRCYDMITTL